MRTLKILAAIAVLSSLATAPAGALQTTAAQGEWGCVALDAVGGFCLSSPFAQLGL